VSRVRKCEPLPALLFNGKLYATPEELQRARDAWQSRRRRWLDLIERDRLRDDGTGR
jgi:hypothetical protein